MEAIYPLPAGHQGHSVNEGRVHAPDYQGDPYAMYDPLCRLTGVRHDPCVLDTFIAAVRYMEGGPKKPWWAFTAERKRELAARNAAE